MTVKRTGLIGWPVAHSLSPHIHGHWMRTHGLRGGYDVFPIEAERIPMFLDRVRAGEFAGINVTVPHKETVMTHLDTVDGLARSIGAVNTIIRQEDGTLSGTNTDSYGFIAHLEASLPEWNHAIRTPLLLGAGGAARGVVHALLDAGANKVRVANRTREKALALQQAFPDIEIIHWDEREKALSDASLLVNTTSLGMTDKPELQCNLAKLSPHAAVYDIVYAPLETTLLRDARAKGCLAIDGLGMLFYQAQKAFSHWWGITPAVDEALRSTVLKEAS